MGQGSGWSARHSFSRSARSRASPFVYAASLCWPCGNADFNEAFRGAHDLGPEFIVRRTWRTVVEVKIEILQNL